MQVAPAAMSSEVPKRLGSQHYYFKSMAWVSSRQFRWSTNRREQQIRFCMRLMRRLNALTPTGESIIVCVGLHALQTSQSLRI